jgi:hypothetical protein
MKSRRKTSRAVITRTSIDGKVDMRESPDRIVFTMASWRRAFSEPPDVGRWFLPVRGHPATNLN